MIEEKMRPEFEAAAEEHFWLQDLRRDYDKAEQEYLDEIVQTAWEFWKLSREALQAESEKLVEALKSAIEFCENPANRRRQTLLQQCHLLDRLRSDLLEAITPAHRKQGGGQ